MIRKALGLLAPLLAAALVAGVVFAAPGDHISAADFDTQSSRKLASCPRDIAWSGSDFYVSTVHRDNSAYTSDKCIRI